MKGKVDDSDKTREVYSHDASLFHVTPQVVVTPKDTADVQALVRFVKTARAEGRPLSLTARAAGTDMSGGPLTESIVVNMLGFNRILEIGNLDTQAGGYAVVEPGVYFRDFDRETKKRDLMLPSYTASRELCTVGGMVANDSGGELNLKYGKTARYVEELEVVLEDGNVHTLKHLSGVELQVKRSEGSYEGNLVRDVAALIARNQDTIQGAKPGVEKNSSGLALWDVGNGVDSLNLARLMVGAQGTMGIITKIKFRLVQPKKYTSMAVLFLDGLQTTGTLVPKILRHQPDSVESYDDNTFMLATKYFPEFAFQMKANIFSLGLSFLPEMWRLLTSGIPKLVVLVEFQSDSQDEARRKAEAIIAELRGQEGVASTLLAPTERAARKYWTIRRESFHLLRKKVRGLRTAPFIDDFVVPPQCLSEFLPALNTLLQEYALTYTIAGHIGDGNFHIIPLIEPGRTDLRQLVEELSERVYDLVIRYDGSISGEHNDGYVRTPFVERMFGADMAALFKQVEEMLDPLDVFNPGKKVVRGDVDPYAFLDYTH